MRQAYTTPKDCGGYPHTRECLTCSWRWHAPTSGEECPRCKAIALLRKVLKVHGPGHNLDDLRALGFMEGTRDLLLEMLRRGEVTRFGAYWWLKVKAPKSYPKQAPPPPAQPLKVALQQAGIQQEKGHIVKRVPRKKTV